MPFDTALKIEARWFTHVLMDPSSSAMIRSLFINKEALEKGANRPDAPDQKVRKLGVLGAGMMGAGITLVSAQAGMEVVLIDQKQEAADKGKSYTADYMDSRDKARQGHRGEEAETLDRITATTDYAALKGCDLIIEAVFEDPAIKAEATKKALAEVGERLHLRHQHLDPADHRPGAGQRQARGVHRHPLLLAGGKDVSGRDHQGPGNRPARRGQGARLRPANPQDPHRGERRAVLLRQPLHHPLYQRRHPHGGRGRGPRAHRQRGAAIGLSGRAAATGGRDLDRPRRQDRPRNQGGDGRRVSRRGRGRGDLLDGGRGAAGPQGECRVLRL